MPIVVKEARRLSRNDAFTMDDLVQEGMVAAISAMESFDPARGDKNAYVRVCARNRMISYLRHGAHELPVDEEILVGSIDADPLVASENQHEAVEVREALANLLAKLSPFEQKVLAAYLSGGSTSEAAQSLSMDRKKIDNALQRIRIKARAETIFTLP
ncbi:sigma-70 family RNA polymerase sigma factor [Synergistaceae bacterium OttesenSCG-928-I11]|nr:sigma-70 family RNA polymerase sigma factor [Synergistaceae bacterium OttesenSCG-928-I11]